ncbi:hemerythrin domain-containing protein [Sphingomonas sp.]|uniref:hemerythrin domain-containing protein n=1 Tax=Sphingomonas sp. TaxID=28214 RepID=UPI0017A88717|nr:hemerythrin domain-containing protein [Sphingomonas sp.]MBA3511358.1 hemerythrin domain-containing protein [Sphingomonas sp.]
MATRTQNRSSNQRSNGAKSGGNSGQASRGDSAFSWGKNGGGALLGAALAGAAIGLAANFGRKFLTHSLSGASGDWDEVLATEHDMALAIFDKMLATDETQTFKRSMLLMKLTHALDKHAHEEEMVVYPALREANEAHDADALEGEHGYVKTFIYELNQMGTDAPNWLDKVREFRALVQKHAHMEEEEVFPRFKERMSEEQNARITSLVNRDGFWQA